METPRKSRENKLSASLEFVISLDKQLRTPLSTIMGMLELMEIESLSDDQYKKLESIQKAANEISLLVDDLHQIVESESLGTRSDVKPFNLEQLMMLFQNKLRRLGVTTILRMSPKIPEALIGDLNAMIEIMAGAWFYASELSVNDASIELSLSQQAGKLSIIKMTIRQSDVRYSMDDLSMELNTPAGFAKFRCVSQRAGFQFILAKSRLSQLKLEPEWSIEDGAFEMAVYFECANQETLNGTSKSSNANVLMGKRVLVAEDVELNQLVTRLMLESFGCKVVIAANGKKALEIYRPDQFDIVIMDIEMPIMNGIEATKSLREKFGSEIKIIGLSADALGNDSEYYVENGFTDYLTKPVKKEFLAQKLRDCLPSMTGTVA